MGTIEEILILGLAFIGAVVIGMFIASAIIKTSKLIRNHYSKQKRNKK
jgi:uncharacterized protein YneF (UPF0154 family)